MTDTATIPTQLMNVPVKRFEDVMPAQDAVVTDLELAQLPLNDYGNSLRLLHRHGKDLLAVSRVGWHVWDGKRYARELGEANAMKKCHEVAVAMAAERAALKATAPQKLKDNASEDEQKKHGEQQRLHDGKLDRFSRFMTSTGNITRIKAMLASAEPYLVRAPNVIDADPWLFNCANGTLDLQRALDQGLEDDEADPRLRPHDRRDLLTKLAPIDFDRAAPAPNFTAFLERIQPDPSVRTFLQTWFGYCISGDVSEQKMVIMHGLGSNGKSTLINAIVNVMGDYSATLDISSFLASREKRGGEATPDLARLPGTRLVVASEPDAGARLNESSVKVITGGERMAVRQLFQEQFEFEPSFKVVISCNHRPTIRGQDHGIWRRILVVPFNVTMTNDQKDPHLNRKLAAEGPGILSWLLDGLTLYRERGLVVPDAIADAIEDYRNESDPIGQFLKSCTIPTPHVGPQAERVRAAELYDRYVAWSKENAQEAISTTAFGKRMIDRGFKRHKVGISYYMGLRLMTEEEMHD